MKYNTEYYILCDYVNEMGKATDLKVVKVKGTNILYGFLEYSDRFEHLPKLFIYKDGERYVLSDAMSGLKVWSSYKLKELKEWVEDPSISKMIVERYNEYHVEQTIKTFCDLINKEGRTI